VLGPQAAETFDAMPSTEPAPSRLLSASGYAVFRSRWSADADYVCFDCGPQAAGLRRDDVPSAAHGHADCLSVIATLAGQPVLIDPGFYCYNGPSDWEIHFRKTAAHSTISLDGRDQARHVAKMAWTHTYTASFESASVEGAIGWARGSHDGYAEGGHGVVHRRSVWLRPGGYIVIVDELTGPAGRIARANFQFAPGSLELNGDAGALFDRRFDVSWSCSSPVKAAVIHRGEAPSDGWIAPSLGVRTRAPRLLLEFPIEQNRTTLLTILADRQRCAVQGHTAHTLTAGIEGHGWEDHIVANASGKPIRWLNGETDALVAVSRTGERGAADVRTIGGTFVRGLEELAGNAAGRPVWPAGARG
jgi:hypothetical protein